MSHLASDDHFAQFETIAYVTLRLQPDFAASVRLVSVHVRDHAIGKIHTLTLQQVQSFPTVIKNILHVVVRVTPLSSWSCVGSSTSEHSRVDESNDYECRICRHVLESYVRFILLCELVLEEMALVEMTCLMSHRMV